MAGDGAGGGYPLSTPSTSTPAQLRRTMRRARRALTTWEQRDHGIAVADRLKRHPLFARFAGRAELLPARLPMPVVSVRFACPTARDRDEFVVFPP